MTLSSFIEKSGVKILWKVKAGINPNMEIMERGASKGMHNFHVMLSMGERRMHCFFSTGAGWTRDPEVVDVLQCLISDALSYENAASFEDWAEEYGYNQDSRKAERLFKVISEQSGKLKRFMGDKYEEALSIEID